MAQLVASASVVVLGGVAEVVGSNLARGKIFTASIRSVDSLYPSIYIYIYIYIYENKKKPERLCIMSIISIALINQSNGLALNFQRCWNKMIRIDFKRLNDFNNDSSRILNSINNWL